MMNNHSPSHELVNKREMLSWFPASSIRH